MSPGAPCDPCTLVIFGASGDLTRRKLLPAIYNLAEDALLPDAFAVVGVARQPISEAEFRGQMRDAVEKFVGDAVAVDLMRGGRGAGSLSVDEALDQLVLG